MVSHAASCLGDPETLNPKPSGGSRSCSTSLGRKRDGTCEASDEKERVASQHQPARLAILPHALGWSLKIQGPPPKQEGGSSWFSFTTRHKDKHVASSNALVPPRTAFEGKKGRCHRQSDARLLRFVHGFSSTSGQKRSVKIDCQDKMMFKTTPKHTCFEENKGNISMFESPVCNCSHCSRHNTPYIQQAAEPLVGLRHSRAVCLVAQASVATGAQEIHGKLK